MHGALAPVATQVHIGTMRPLAIPSTLRRPRNAIAVLWLGVAIAAAAQTVAMVRLGAPTVALGEALLRRLAILPLWAAITPCVLRSARRFPLRGVPARRIAANAAAHVALGTAFVVASNVVIRLPFFARGGTLAFAALAHDAALGVATYYPAAMLVYGALVAAGHALGRGAAATDAPVSSTDATLASPRAVAEASAPEPYLSVKQWNRVHLVRLCDIEWIEAEDNYVVVHTAGRALRTRERIGALETQLDPRTFVRIHRSTIVPVGRIREVQPLTHGDHVVILRDGRVLRVSRSRRDALAAALGLPLAGR